MAAIEQFTLEVETVNGAKKEVHFLSLACVPMGLVRTTRNDNQEQMWGILEWAVLPEDLPIIDEVPANQLIPLLTKMQEISQISVGESGASSASSKTTARRSKQT